MSVVKTVVILSALALPASLPAQARYEGAGVTQELDCDGGSATIEVRAIPSA